MVFTAGRFMLSLVLVSVLVFSLFCFVCLFCFFFCFFFCFVFLFFVVVVVVFSPVYHCDHLAWGRERAGLRTSRAIVSMLHALNFVLFSSSWCQGLAATSACGTPGLFNTET